MDNQAKVINASAKRLPTGTRLVVVTILLAISISAFGIYKLRGRKPSIIKFDNLKLLKLTSSGNAVVAAISPDGNYVAYATSDAGKETLLIKPVASPGGDIEIVPPSDGNYRGLSFSPDSKSIYYVRSSSGQPNTISRISTVGGPSTTLNKIVDSAATISPDGKYMSFLRGYPDQKETALIVSPVEGSSERKLTVMKSPSSFVVAVAPTWSPDGKQIAVGGRQDEGSDAQIVVINVADGGFKPVGQKRWQDIRSLSWSVDGYSLVVSATDQYTQAGQLYQVLYPTGNLTRVTNDLSDYQQLSMTRDSSQIVTVQVVVSQGKRTRDVVLFSN